MRENGAASGAGVLALYVYDNLGRRASLTRGNGVVTTYAYDSASQLDVLTHNLSGTANDVTLDFGHNAAGQILSRDRTSANGAYVYPQPGLNVDAYAGNGLNQIASLDGAGFTHDARGNLTSAGGVAYSYDAFNRLLSAGAMSLAYDPAGRLYETTASGTTTRFLYAGLQAIAEYNTSGVLQRRYVPGVGLDEHLAMYEGTGTSDRRWLVQDERGSVVSIADGSGAALSVNSYDEYGVPASGNAGLFGYTGQMYLSQAGLYHYRARAYSPALGRFLQTDSIGMTGGMNLYAYVLNDPLNAIDPLGLQGIPNGPIIVPPEDPPIVVVGPPRPPPPCPPGWRCSSHDAAPGFPGAAGTPGRGANTRRNVEIDWDAFYARERPNSEDEQEAETPCRWTTVPATPGRPDDWRFRSGGVISAVATGVATVSSYDVSAMASQVGPNGQLFDNLCLQPTCMDRRRGFVFAGTQVRQVWSRGGGGAFEWVVTSNGAVPDAGGDLGGDAFVAVQTWECPG